MGETVTLQGTFFNMGESVTLQGTFFNMGESVTLQGTFFKFSHFHITKSTNIRILTVREIIAREILENER